MYVHSSSLFSPLTHILNSFKGDDWHTAKLTGSTPLHIMDKTGFSIELKKSIVPDDALLPR